MSENEIRTSQNDILMPEHIREIDNEEPSAFITFSAGVFMFRFQWFKFSSNILKPRPEFSNLKGH